MFYLVDILLIGSSDKLNVLHPASLVYPVFNMPGSPLLFFIFTGVFILSVVAIIFFLQMKLNEVHRILNEARENLTNLEITKNELEIREKNMTESLVYAQRIQEAMLPSEDYLRKHFRDSFIFYMPRDIVSGDFYWLEEKNEKVFLVAADCTGHGVPGALMSVIGLEILNKAINEENIEDPSKILAVLNKALEKTFNREKNIGTIIRDGMDIGLCVFDRKSRKIEFAGAFFSIYLIRDNNLVEIKGDKLIIGMNPGGLPYTTKDVDLQDDDIIYIFSDGYVDQFGGVDNKKFMYRRFKYLLMTIHKFPVADQKSILDENLRTWKGPNRQIDDIMVIGFKPLSGHSN